MEANKVENNIKKTSDTAEAPAAETGSSEEKKRKNKKSSSSGLIKGVALGAAGVIVVECVAGALLLGGSDKLNIISIDTKIKEIETLIDCSYLYDADKQDLEDGIFTGLVYGLTDDRYSAYYSATDYNQEKKRLEGNYVGIGVTITKDEETGGIRVEAVNPSGPAEKAGVQVGDIIIKADGTDLTQEDSDYAVSLITGEEGTSVTITLLRDSEELELTVNRENITTVSVQSLCIPEEQALTAFGTGEKHVVRGTKIGYISISTFNQTTYREFNDELVDYLLGDEEVGGVIIDLRNNGGGDMNICLEMLDKILADDIEVNVNAAEVSEGQESADTSVEADSDEKAADGDAEIYNYAADGSETDETGTLLLSVEAKDGESSRFYATDRSHIDVPIVVVVNAQSASASEIFAGALRDYGYQIVGTKSFGKGIVQSLYNLHDGSAVKFTTDQYRLPGGELIHGKGIEPTIEVEFEEYDDVMENSVNSANGSIQPDIMKDKQIAAAVIELERQIYEAYQQ